MNQFWTVPRHNPLQPRDDNLKENSELSDSRRSADMERLQDFPARPLSPPFPLPATLHVLRSEDLNPPPPPGIPKWAADPNPRPAAGSAHPTPPTPHLPWLRVGMVLHAPCSAAPLGRGGGQELRSTSPPPQKKPDMNIFEWGANKEQFNHGAGRGWGSEPSQETPPLLREGEEGTRKQYFT